VKSRRSIVPFVVLGLLVSAVYPLQRWIDRVSAADRYDEEVLYLASGESVRRLAFGYEALLADLYWMRVVQHFGRTVLADPTVLNRTDRSSFKLLYPLTEIVTTLDPRYISAYRFGAVFVHDYVDPSLSYPLLERGIEHNPTNTFLYQDLGFLLWSDGRCQEAAEVYERASKIPSAPKWFAILGPTVVAECGDRDFARQMLVERYESTEDVRVREDILRKLAGLQALDEIDLLEDVVAFYKQQTGRLPESLAEMLRVTAIPQGPGRPSLRVDSQRRPLDPTGVPYAYDPQTGEVKPDPNGIKLTKRFLTRRQSQGL
jgi:tetratricopeptide (TPR) repeat protein